MTIGTRLKDERKRLGYNQTDFAALYGVSKSTQIDYEKDAFSPNARQLEIIAGHGADILYIVTGIPSAATLTTDEIRLLGLFRSASVELKAAAIGTLSAGMNTGTAKQIIHGNVGQTVEGNSYNAQINMGKVIKKEK